MFEGTERISMHKGSEASGCHRLAGMFRTTDTTMDAASRSATFLKSCLLRLVLFTMMPALITGCDVISNSTFRVPANGATCSIDADCQSRHICLRNSCEPECHPRCEHGGKCTSIDTCECPVNTIGTFCEQCVDGWEGARCDQAICSHPCKNGGSCSEPEICRCAGNWTGASCETCAGGWGGPQCNTAICSAGCPTNQVCTKPETCGCADGWTGTTCQTPQCNPTCSNGGTCVAPNQCRCIDGWSGPTCEQGPPAGFVRLRPGSFTMGSPSSEAGRSSDENQHSVTITKAFLIQISEVTQSQYQDVMGYNPAYHLECGGACPVEQVSWVDAMAYLNTLSDLEGLERCYGEGWAFRGLGCRGYRLPTEAEWEYAARAGSTSSRYGDVGSIAWFSGNSSWEARKTKLKLPNAWGLYDMLGNVSEWVQDWYAGYGGAVTDPTGAAQGDFVVTRGGAWDDDSSVIRTASRVRRFPNYRFSHLGFRAARTVP
jgi:formylglycine-generating enzyme required for sulfatase activity